MADQDADAPNNPGRRGFLQFAAAAPAALAIPTAAPATEIIKTDLLKKVMPLLVQGAAPGLDYPDLLNELKEVLAAPSSQRSNEQVIRALNRLQRLSYDWNDLKTSPYGHLTAAELSSPQWEKLEQEWLPILYPDDPQTIERFARARHELVDTLHSQGFADHLTLSETADTFKTRCVRASHAMIRQAYSRDPLGFVNLFHKDGANFGLQLHYYYDPEKGYKDFGEWIPTDIARHIESMFPFSSWGKKRSPEPTGLHDRLFSAGRDEHGSQLFHLALSLPQAKQAMALVLGSEAVETLEFRQEQNGGVVFALDPDQYSTVGAKITNLLPAPSPDEIAELPVPIISDRERISHPSRESEIGGL